jgi:molybdopterin converting factor small subunit|nr:hypothetical protein [Fredinandcohnia onubensis]
MTAKTLTSFASGLLLASAVCAVVYFSGPQQATSSSSKEKPTVEELKSQLAAEGYVIHTEDEWNNAIAGAKNTEKVEEQPKEEVKEEVKEEKKEEPAEPVVHKTVITVSEGMTSYEVGKALISAKIISGDAWDFANLVEKKGVAKYLKLGSHEINSNMTTDEIIATIFNK